MRDLFIKQIRENSYKIYTILQEKTSLKHKKFIFVEEIKSTKRSLKRVFIEVKANKAFKNRDYSAYVCLLNKRLHDNRTGLKTTMRSIEKCNSEIESLKQTIEDLNILLEALNESK